MLATQNGYAVHKAIMASGGDTRGSEQYSTQDIIGQTAAGSSQSEDYALHTGFYSPFRAEPVITPTVGIDVYPVDKLSIILPWLLLVMTVIVGCFALTRRRVHG